MSENTDLSQLKDGESATVKSLEATGSIRRRMLDLGLIEGTEVECIRKSPLGDPVAYMIRGAVIALRKEDSSQILIEC